MWLMYFVFGVIWKTSNSVTRWFDTCCMPTLPLHYCYVTLHNGLVLLLLSLCSSHRAILTDVWYFFTRTTYSQDSSMPQPTVCTPSGADLGGSVVFPVMLVTMPQSKSTKTVAKWSETFPITLPSVSNFTTMAATLRELSASLSQKKVCPTSPIQKTW